MNKKIKTKLSALLLLAAFGTTQASFASFDTGLGETLGGAKMLEATGGLKTIASDGTEATLHLISDTHVKWDTLNIGKHERMNFHAVDGNTGITVLNTVQNGMSQIYGRINANSGIKNLIISNPNGILFDGATFTGTGDIMLTTQPMNGVFGTDNCKMNVVKEATNQQVGIVQILGSTFNTGGSINVLAPAIEVSGGKLTGKGGVKFHTVNGQDYLATGNLDPKVAVRMDAVDITGNVQVVSDKGIIRVLNGGKIKGNLNLTSNDSVFLNYTDNGKTLTVNGSINAKNNGTMMYGTKLSTTGSLTMQNGGGFLEVKNVSVGKNMNLKTTAESENAEGYKHFVHVIGNNTVGGNANIEAVDNIHIGNYKIGEKFVDNGCCGTTKVLDYSLSTLLPGKFTVKGALTAHSQNGHIMTTVDVNAKTLDFKADKLNILSSENALITANDYKFTSNGYIGAIADGIRADGSPISATEQIVGLMENYTFIPKDISSHSYMNINGGTISRLDAPTNSEVYIASKENLTLTGANAYNVNLTAPAKRIDITGKNVHANNINVAGETDYLKVDFPSRDYTLNYTNIKDEKVVTVRPNEEITYELTDGENGYNQPTLKPGEKTTYLYGPENPNPPAPVIEPEPIVEPDPEPQPEPIVTPEPEPIVTPEPEPQPEPIVTPEPTIEPEPIVEREPIVNPAPQPTPDVEDNNENARNLMSQWSPEDVTEAQAATPVAYAAEMDDEDNGTPIRKNVDGSVTVVRAFAIK